MGVHTSLSQTKTSASFTKEFFRDSYMTCTKEENLTYDANIHNNEYKYTNMELIEGSLEVKLPTIWTDEKQSREEAERRERLEERRVEEKESEERRYRCAKR